MRPSVLVVDDERSFRLLAEEALSSEGFDVRTAGTLARARVELDKTAPDVMILDRRLPDGDGIDLLRELKTAGQLTSQVIVVTAYADVSNAVEALQAGAVDYLTKPLQVTDLIIKLRKVLEYEAAEVLCTDVYIKDPAFYPLGEVLDRSDILIVGAPHREYRGLKLPEGKTVVDIWNIYGKGASLA